MTVSVIIPTYKRNNYCKLLLNSLIDQTFKDFEVILIDDCGYLNEDLRSFSESLKEYFDISYINERKNNGVQYCRNLGVRVSKFDTLCFVDDDDIWHSTKLEKQMNRMTVEHSLCYTDAEIIDENGLIIDQWQTLDPKLPAKEILNECFIPSPSIMVKKKCLIEAGGFDERFPACQDWDAWTRVIYKNPKICRVAEKLVQYRKHTGESVGTSANANRAYRMYSRKHLLKAIAQGDPSLVYKHIKRSLVGLN